jgi:DeoR/GlpR family transcriptional regulator of sugar metabolism
MSIDARDIRYAACGGLLAKVHGGAIVIQRDALHARVACQL